VLIVLTVVTALGCGLIAGVFFAFSSFVMKALARIPAAQGIAAMQSISIVVLNPAFLGVFLGTAAGCAGVAIWAVADWDRRSGLLITGSILYLVGTVGVTRVFHIPLNDALAKADPSSAAGARIWSGYRKSWTIWNHVRTAAALAAAAAFVTAIL